MDIFLTLFIPLVAIALLCAPLVPVVLGKVTGKKVKRNVLLNICSFGGVCLVALICSVGGIVSAAEASTAVSGASAGMGYLAAALVTGLSCLGAGIAVAAAAPAAIGAVSEDPKSFGKAMIFVVLGEGVAIYGLLISILILNRL